MQSRFNVRGVIISSIIWLIALFWHASLQAQLFEQPVPAYPLADTMYYPVSNGLQLVQIDHLTDYRLASAAFSHMSQPPRMWWFPPLGNEYILRDTAGNIIKRFNTSLSADSMKKRLRPPLYVNRPHHDADLFNESEESFQNGYYKIFNYSIQEFTHPDSLMAQNLKTGLIDSMGNIVIPRDYQEIRMVQGCFLLKKAGKWAVWDAELQEQMPHLYKDITVYGPLIYGYEDHQYKRVFDTRTRHQQDLEGLELRSFDPEDGIFMIKKEEQWGLINVLENKMLIPCQYDRVITYFYYGDFRYLTYGYVVVIKDQKYGVVNIADRTILPCKYEKIFWGSDSPKGFIKVKMDGEIREIPHKKIVLRQSERY